MSSRLGSLALVIIVLLATSLRAENRTINGTGNNIQQPNQGAANQPFIRFGYGPQFFGTDSALPSETQRPNARNVSNAVAAQPESLPSARRLSNYIWAWGQFLTHDTDLSTTSNGATVNGTAPIPVHDPIDPLGPNPIPFTRANFVLGVTAPAIGPRTPINEVTSYIDASNVYGSDAVRAAALRTNGGFGAKLLTDENNLLPRNMAGLPNENNGPVPGNQMFLAGDIRSNENSLLTSLHTIFAREHNRLVDRIAAQQPGLSDEDQYQLARKLVGAEMQAITYHEFLPALLGDATTVPRAELYVYSPQLPASITTAFSHAAFRFGHSAVTSELKLVGSDNAPAGSLSLRNVFFNPGVIANDPTKIDQLMLGAATQRSEEIDIHVVDDLRNFLFGPPGAGGLDLASLNIQRARDAGVPNLAVLSRAYGFGNIPSFDALTGDPALAQTLAGLYNNTLTNVDLWVAGLAQVHMSGSSVGNIFQRIIESQFRRLRDNDRLFFRANASGLYTNGVLNPDVASLVDLDHLTLADVLLSNTSITHLQDNVFFVPAAGDFNGDGMVDTSDYVVWRKSMGTANVWADADGSGTVGPEDLAIWQANFGSGTLDGTAASLAQVPEPFSAALLAMCVSVTYLNSRGCTARRQSNKSMA